MILVLAIILGLALIAWDCRRWVLDGRPYAGQAGYSPLAALWRYVRRKP